MAWAARAPRLRLTDVCVEIPSRTRSAFLCADAARSKSRSMRRKRSSWSTTAASASSASARRRSRSLRSRFFAFLRSALASSSSSSSSRFSSMDGALSSSGSVLTTLPSAAFVDTPSSSSAWRVSSVSANVTSRVSRGLAWDLPAFLALYRVNASSTGPFFGLRFLFTPESSDNSSSSPSPSPSFSPIARAASAAECANAAAAAASAAWRAARSSKSAFRESDTAPDPSANSSLPRLNGSPSNSASHGASAAMAAL